MWKYYITYVLVSTSQIVCPDLQYGYDCGKMHTVEDVIPKKVNFSHREHAVRFIKERLTENAREVRLDSFPDYGNPETYNLEGFTGPMNRGYWTPPPGVTVTPN